MIEFKPGFQIDEYTLEEHIGVGGTAEVWKIKNAVGKRKAMKIVSPSQRLDKVTLDLFIKEYELTTGLKHPNILTPDKISEFNGRPYIISPLCDTCLQKELNRRLSFRKDKKTALFSETELSLILNQTARALNELHTQKIIHNDIKPANILVKQENGSNNYLISDFGISTKLRKTIIQHTQTFENYNSNAGITPDYAAPERFKGQIHSPSDIFSLGILLYEMATGHVPFQNPNYSPGELLIRGFVPPPMDVDCSNRFKAIVQLCLRESPSARPTAKQLITWSNSFLTERFWPNEIEELTKNKVKKNKFAWLSLVGNTHLKKVIMGVAATLVFFASSFGLTNSIYSAKSKVNRLSNMDSAFYDYFLMGKNKTKHHTVKFLKSNYNEIGYADGDLFQVKNQDGKWGYVNKDGEVIVELEFDKIGELNKENKYTIFLNGETCGFISTANKKTKEAYQLCWMVSNTVGGVKYKNKYGKLIEQKLNLIDLLDE